MLSFSISKPPSLSLATMSAISMSSLRFPNPRPPARDMVINFGRYKGQMLGTLPSTYLKWISKNIKDDAARDHWALRADEVLADPVYKDRIEWEHAYRIIYESEETLAELLKISKRFGWDHEDGEGWKKVKLTMLGTSLGGRIPRLGNYKEKAAAQPVVSSVVRRDFINGGLRKKEKVSSEEERRRERRRERLRMMRKTKVDDDDETAPFGGLFMKIGGGLNGIEVDGDIVEEASRSPLIPAGRKGLYMNEIDNLRKKTKEGGNVQETRSSPVVFPGRKGLFAKMEDIRRRVDERGTAG